VWVILVFQIDGGCRAGARRSQDGALDGCDGPGSMWSIEVDDYLAEVSGGLHVVEGFAGLGEFEMLIDDGL